MAYTVKFVDSIASSPTTRLDLNTGSVWTTLSTSRFDPPPIRRALVESMLADGATPAANAYGNRVITLVLDLPKSYTEDQAAAQLQTLMRELDRPNNTLRVEWGTNTATFFRTFRTPAEQLDFDPVHKQVTVPILAEPFGYGVEETLAPVTVNNNPAAGSNGMFLDITSPKGDVETPLYLTVGGTIGVTGRLQSGISVRRRGTPSSTPFFLQAEAMTQGTNTTTQANSASFSGSGNNYSRCTFGTASMQTRLSIAAFPTSPSVNARGTYRVFARVRQNTAADVIDVRLLWGSVTTQVTNSTVRLPVDTGPSAPTIKYVDLGLVQMPVGYDPVYDGLSGVELSVEGLYLAFQAQRVSGTGTLDIDLLLFMPADDRLMFVKWPEVQNSPSDVFVAVGGSRPAVYCLNASGQLVSTQSVEIVGGGPMITPGVTNRIFYARDLGTGTALTGAGDSITATTTVTASYFPRYLRPATT